VEIPNWLKNLLAHGLAGFVIGFNAAFVLSDFKDVNWEMALKGALIMGGYNAIKAILAHLSGTLPKTTQGGKSSVKFADRMP
jgi:hypothetical protein